MPTMSPVFRRPRAAPRGPPAAPQHSRDRERALEERDAVQPGQVDGAALAIVVELERPVDVRRSPERHADRTPSRADRPLAPPPLTRLRQEAVERLLTGDDSSLAGSRAQGTPRHEHP